MAIKTFLKNPVFMIGILFAIIAYLDYEKRKEGSSLFEREALKSTSCHAILVSLEKRVPKNWKVSCQGNVLYAKIEEKKLPDGKALSDLKTPELKTYLYRQLANHLIFISKNILSESLARVDLIKMVMKSPNLDIEAFSTGEAITHLATLKNPEFIKKHLQNSVKIKEVSK